MRGIRNDLINRSRIWWYDVNLYPDVNELAFVYDPPMCNCWGIELESLNIGTKLQKIERTSSKSGKGASFDHANYGRGTALTPNAYTRLARTTGATPVDLQNPPNSGPQLFYSVDCSEIAPFPILKYKFSGRHRKCLTLVDRDAVASSHLADGDGGDVIEGAGSNRPSWTEPFPGHKCMMEGIHNKAFVIGTEDIHGGGRESSLQAALDLRGWR
ncbi:Eukaryotic aspartyl protease [Tolypocladium capitatum]|uniref:Eukaryotic aspartyl protease n=1 Tax=Tolypocladium capitatum TaxID=45235 RepID=A0A2K3QL37_9HYPO|nr:Eukaryotic aspartyl protease [Tolypocladium capitatum]